MTFEEAKKNVDVIVDQVSEVVDDIVANSLGNLDELMTNINRDIIDKYAHDEDVHLDTVRSYLVQLSAMQYAAAATVERTGLYDSVSKIKMREKYDMSFLSNDVAGADGKKPTATKLAAIAEDEAKCEAIINEMYNKAYRIMKSKVEQASIMVNTLNKLLGSLMNDVAYLEQQSKNRILNEEF